MHISLLAAYAGCAASLFVGRAHVPSLQHVRILQQHTAHCCAMLSLRGIGSNLRLGKRHACLFQGVLITTSNQRELHAAALNLDGMGYEGRDAIIHPGLAQLPWKRPVQGPECRQCLSDGLHTLSTLSHTPTTLSNIRI